MPTLPKFVDAQCAVCDRPFKAKRVHVEAGMGRFCSSICYGTTRKRTEADLWARADRPEVGCWPWQGPLDIGGYGRMRYHGRTYQAHALAWILTNGPIPKGLIICHHCDNRRCIRPSHLYAGTQKQNAADAIERGRHISADPEKMAAIPKVRGEDHPNSKVTWDIARSIRARVANGAEQKALAVELGLNRHTIFRIVHNTAWKE